MSATTAATTAAVARTPKVAHLKTCESFKKFLVEKVRNACTFAYGEDCSKETSPWHPAVGFLFEKNTNRIVEIANMLYGPEKAYVNLSKITVQVDGSLWDSTNVIIGFLEHLFMLARLPDATEEDAQDARDKAKTKKNEKMTVFIGEVKKIEIRKKAIVEKAKQTKAANEAKKAADAAAAAAAAPVDDEELVVNAEPVVAKEKKRRSAPKRKAPVKKEEEESSLQTSNSSDVSSEEKPQPKKQSSPKKKSSVAPVPAAVVNPFVPVANAPTKRPSATPEPAPVKTETAKKPAAPRKSVTPKPSPSVEPIAPTQSAPSSPSKRQSTTSPSAVKVVKKRKVSASEAQTTNVESGLVGTIGDFADDDLFDLGNKKVTGHVLVPKVIA